MISVKTVAVSAAQLIGFIVAVRERQHIITGRPGQCADAYPNIGRLEMDAIREVIEINTRNVGVTDICKQNCIFADVERIINANGQVLHPPERHPHKLHALIKIGCRRRRVIAPVAVNPPLYIDLNIMVGLKAVHPMPEHIIRSGSCCGRH